LPPEEEEHFNICFWVCTGAIPRFGLDFTTSKPTERPLTETEAKFLAQPDPYNPSGYHRIFQGYEHISTFFGDYLLKQDLSDKQSELDAFSTSPDEDVRLTNGLALLAEAAIIATADLNEKFAAVKKAGLLHPYVEYSGFTPESLVARRAGMGKEKIQVRLLGAMAALFADQPQKAA
jgi:hypothetical protein